MKRWAVILYWLFWPRQYECEWYFDRCGRLRLRPKQG